MIASILTEGASSVLSADVPLWYGFSQTATPAEFYGDSGFTEIANYAGSDDKPRRLISFATRRGRNYDLGRVEAGTLSATFANLDGILEPSNPESELYPNVLPMKRQRILRHENGVTYRVFDGPAERYEADWVVSRNDDSGRAGYQRVRVDAVDAFEVLNNLVVNTGYAAASSTALSGTHNDLTFTPRNPGGGESYEYVDWDPTNTDASFHALEVSVSGKKLTVKPEYGGSPSFLRTSTASLVRAAIEAHPEANALFAVSYPAGNNGSGYLNSSGGSTVVQIAEVFLSGGTWPQETTGERITRILDECGWPADARVIDSGLYEVVAESFDDTSVLALLQETADSELGYVFVDAMGRLVFHDGAHRGTSERSLFSRATFTDGSSGGHKYHGLIPVLDKDRIYNHVTVVGGAETSIPQVVEDTASQGIYLVRSLSPKTTLLAEDSDCLTIAQLILDNTANPAQRFDSITTIDTGVDGWLDATLGLEIGDRVTVVTHPPNTDVSLSFDCFVEAIQVDATVGQPWAVTLQLTSVDVSTSGGLDGPLLDSSGDFFVLDSGTAGVLG